MNYIDDGRYKLVISCFGAMLGLCFAAVRAELVETVPDAATVWRLDARFMEFYGRCARPTGADGTALQATIDDIGWGVRGGVLRC